MLLSGITLQQQPGTSQDAYERLCETPSSYDSAIKRDIGRTLPQAELFRDKNGKGQLALFRLLRSIAIRISDIGYCQSMNFIVATLIGVFPDNEAAVFECALALLLRHSLVDLYRPKFEKLGVVVWQFDKVVEGFLPKVHAALVKHGVNSEYYAIQWFLTLFASDLPQDIVRRIWDRFLVAGWRIVVQVGLALLYSIRDTLPTMNTCQALGFLRRFGRASKYEAEELLRLATTFKVSHRMLSALEAAYSWEDDVQLLVAKDLNSGHVHWAIQAVPPAKPSCGPLADCEDEDSIMPIPRAFNRTSEVVADEDEPRPKGTVEPFLLHNLDTGETTVIEKAWSQYTREIDRRARDRAGPAVVQPAQSSAVEAPRASLSLDSDSMRRNGPDSGGSFWMQSVQREAVRRLGQV